MTNSNESANGYGFCTANGENVQEEKGLTKREYFAAAALQGILSDRELQLAIITDYTGDKNNAWAEEAVIQADLLIKALNK